MQHFMKDKHKDRGDVAFSFLILLRLADSSGEEFT